MPSKPFGRLQDEQKRLQKAYEQGLIDVPSHLVDQGFPLWLVIDRLIDFKEDHRQRSSDSKRVKPQLQEQV